MPAEANAARVREICEATLRQNWREGLRPADRVPFAYTSPSPGHYPWQWYWDSCFTAIAWRHFDPGRSRRELALGQPSLTPMIVERMYDPGRGLFWPLAKPELRDHPPLTWTALSPLALPDLPEEIGRRLVEEHLLDPDSFWLEVPPPSVSAGDPAFTLYDEALPGVRRYWRGPTWINSAWLVWLGLVRLGYEDEATELAARITDTVAREGLREYYNSHSGQGMGAVEFGWSSLVMEMVSPDPRAATSYLEGQPPRTANLEAWPKHNERRN